jgi:hypothetical protein
MAQTGSVYLTVCVTVERFVAVCRPLQAKSICTYGRWENTWPAAGHWTPKQYAPTASETTSRPSAGCHCRQCPYAPTAGEKTSWPSAGHQCRPSPYAPTAGETTSWKSAGHCNPSLSLWQEMGGCVGVVLCTYVYAIIGNKIAAGPTYTNCCLGPRCSCWWCWSSPSPTTCPAA